MPRRAARHTQTELERLKRAAEAVTGQPHFFRARPDGSIDILPLEPDSAGVSTAAATLAPQLGDLPEPVL